jgi:hypothetical protein
MRSGVCLATRYSDLCVSCAMSTKKLRAERAAVSRLSFDSDIEFQTLRVPLP